MNPYQRWYAANKEKKKADRRQYYADNRDKALAYAKTYRQTPEARLAASVYMQHYVLENGDKLREQKRLWYTQHRDEVMNRVRISRGNVGELPEYWPYGAEGEPFDSVNAFVPRGIPEATRADICQELCMMIISGDVLSDELDTVFVEVKRQAYGRWHRSIDEPMGDGWTIADTLEDPEGEYQLREIEERYV